MRRRKRRGKHYGNWVERIDGVDVNLGTTDAGAARIKARELKLAAEAKRAAADKLIERAKLEAAADAALGVGAAPADIPAPPPWVFDKASPAAEESPTSSQPSPATPVDSTGSSSSSSPSSAGWADDLNAAAGGAAAADDGTDAGAELPFLDPAWVENIVDQAADVCVELQVRIQEWAWRRYGKIEVARVARDDDSRKPGAAMWKHFIRRKLPDKIPIPDWAAAIAVVAMQTTPVQLAGARRAGTPPAAAAPEPRVDEAEVVGAAA